MVGMTRKSGGETCRHVLVRDGRLIRRPGQAKADAGVIQNKIPGIVMAAKGAAAGLPDKDGQFMVPDYGAKMAGGRKTTAIDQHQDGAVEMDGMRGRGYEQIIITQSFFEIDERLVCQVRDQGDRQLGIPAAVAADVDDQVLHAVGVHLSE